MASKKIWVLGSEHLSADKSISWLSPFPNFSNCDILIVNLQSLGEQQYQRRRLELYNEARKYIYDLLMTSEKEAIIILTSQQNQMTWLPIYPIIERIAPGEIGEYKVESYLIEYMKTVEECPFYIRKLDVSYFDEKTNPESEQHEIYHFTKEALYGYECGGELESRIENQAKQMIGCCIRCTIKYGYSCRYTFSSGRVHFLPPPTRATTEQAIDMIINVLTERELKEPPPAWENKIDLPGLEEIEKQIGQKEETKKTLIGEIEALRNEKNAKIKFRRLLWTRDTPLEDTVRDAFISLGFPEIRKIREKNLEDWVIEFRFVPEYQFGVFEVKGADKRTSLADLTQCNKWVEDYMLDNKKAKGIFVPNQYRLGDIRTNQEDREHFEDNELKYAETREICILPSHEIFFAILKKMENDPKITREHIEKMIVSSKGLCKLV